MNDEIHKVLVDGTTMVYGPGHLTEQEKNQWIAVYREINPDAVIAVYNTYREEKPPA